MMWTGGKNKLHIDMAANVWYYVSINRKEIKNMIGLGKWVCNVSSMLFSGEVKMEIFDDNGSYGFKLDIPNVKIPDVTVKEVKEDGTDVTVTVQTSMLPGKDIVLNATFDGDTFEGVLKIPFVDKVKLKDGRRLA